MQHDICVDLNLEQERRRERINVWEVFVASEFEPNKEENLFMVNAKHIYYLFSFLFFLLFSILKFHQNFYGFM